jgi:O-acetyl-ADP-ribose deacetylase (regulator of RNase III)
MISNSEIAARLEAIEADITTLRVDAIVNAANVPLLRGGGVDGAIRRAAGFEIDEDLERIGRCEPGASVLTFGYRLPANYVIHTVAPVWSGIDDDAREKQIFSACYSSALMLADENEIVSIAFPAIGTGAYRWPPQLAAELARDAVVQHLRGGGHQTRVIFCCFAAEDQERYATLIDALARK